MSMSMSTLPTSRNFVTQLLDSIPSRTRDNSGTCSTPLGDAPEAVKKKLLSLQVLFPNEFLPALDLLDRKLVTRFLIGIAAQPFTGNENAEAAGPDLEMQDITEPLSNATNPALPEALQSVSQNSDTVYYVRSAQQRSSRFSTPYDSTTSYEVRLRAWNCTCPAFAFAAFPSVHPEPPIPTYAPPPALEDNDPQDKSAEAEKSEAQEWVFGMASLGEGMPPVCKHLLACVLVERCKDYFGECVEERSVSVETAAGWAAGWGDI